MWSLADIADAIAAGLASRAHALDEEQAIRGLDALEELELQPHIETALSDAGFGVFREQRYPDDRRRRKRSEGERCDFVLTYDARSLREPDLAETLFDPENAVDLEDALWLEMKVVSQFNDEGPNASYSSQLLSTVRRDVTKLSKDHGILHAAVLLVLFVAEQRIAANDLGVWQDRCLERGLPIGAPYQRDVTITDRMGHGVCAIALYPVSHL